MKKVFLAISIAVCFSACGRSFDDVAARFAAKAGDGGTTTTDPGTGTVQTKPTPTPTTAAVSNFPEIGTRDPNCMSNPAYDACGFLIDPMFHNKVPLSPALTFTSDMRTVQTLGIKLADLDGSGFLRSKYIDVMADPTLQRAKIKASGDFKFDYSDCSSGTCQKDPNQFACQVQMYNGLQKQIDFMENKVFKGAFYPAANGAIKVYAYSISGADAGQTNNAYANGSEIHLLTVNYPTNGANHTIGCDYGVAAHEMCHNVFFAAVKNTMGTPNPNYRQFHEGQGDACGFMVTGEAASAAHSWFNNLDGLPGRKITGNLGLQFDKTGTVEVHEGGKPAAAVYYLLRTDKGSSPSEVDKIWFTALAMISTTDSFQGQGRALLAADKLLFNAGQGKYQTLIRKLYSDRGITL